MGPVASVVLEGLKSI